MPKTNQSTEMDPTSANRKNPDMTDDNKNVYPQDSVNDKEFQKTINEAAYSDPNYSKPGTPPHDVLVAGEPMRPMVDGKVELTESNVGEAMTASVPYKNPSTDALTADNIEERRQAALKVAEDATHLAFVLGRIQKGHAKYTEALNKKLAAEGKPSTLNEQKRQDEEESVRKQLMLEELEAQEKELAAKKIALNLKASDKKVNLKA